MNLTEIFASVAAWWDPRYATAGASFALVLVVNYLALKAIRAARSSTKPDDERTTVDDVLTWIVAAIATAVSAEGSYQVFKTVIKEDWLLWSTFAVIELIMLVSAFRARRYMRKFGSSGIDGIAVWIFAGLTAALASLHALGQGHPIEFLVRLAAPLMSAYLWERGMRLARVIRTGRKRINWTIGLERVLVRLGLAEPAERDTTEVAALRYLTTLAIRTAKLRRLETSPAGTDRRINRATKQQQSALTAALEHTDLATSKQRQDQFMRIYSALVNVATLTRVTPAAFWEGTEGLVVPETVTFEPAPPAPVLAAAKAGSVKEAPKPTNIQSAKPRLNGKKAAAKEFFKSHPNITGEALGARFGASKATGCRWLAEFNK